MRTCIFILSIFLFFGCNSPDTLFDLMDKSTGISFENTLSYTEEFNPYTYRNFYNGAGVSMGDINNDGLIDIYFTGNIVNNKLYINKGNWKFEDITEKAGVSCPEIWSTGSTFVDINGDGLLDIYVCKSGKPGGNNRHNELFINQGDLTFKESSKSYGLDITGLSVHAAFLDYDKDGDLDAYILNNSIRSVGGYDLIKDQRSIPDPNNNGNKFLENQNGFFVDVTEKVGMYNSAIGFGLGITVSDFNNDNWPDLFISNDFFEKDYLYINAQDGNFIESSDVYFDALSMGSMGADAADLDNDLNSDIFVTEMLPSSLKRKKTKAMYDSWDKFKLRESKGYAKQFPRNVLQRNMGENGFLEIGRKSGVAATEWSWASLLFDMDNDGLRDIFIANGINKDLLDRDYLAYMANEEQVRMLMRKKEEVIKKLIDIMPSKAVPNFAYRNIGNFNFENVTEKWGLDQPSFSNGNSYADLDNDGDLDLVVNNVNMESFIYQNKTDTITKRSIQIKLIGNNKNTNAIGSKLILYNDQKKYMAELFPSRGFQSSVSHRIHFGVGSVEKIDSLYVTWPNGDQKAYYNLITNKLIKLDKNSGKTVFQKPKLKLTNNNQLFKFKHIENEFIEFNRERLLTQMRHNEGPALAIGDINSDGKEDIFVGGGKNQKGSLFVSNLGAFYELNNDFLNEDKESEDTNALFIDGDQDGDLDLVVASGGKSFSIYSPSINDRYYVNDGFGNFTKKINALPFENKFSTKALASADINKDGLPDLFFGQRYDLQTYGKKVDGVLMLNEGENIFKEQNQIALKDLGMITDAKFHDFNNDDWIDLVVVGEWMPITILINKNGIFENQTNLYGLQKTSGLWNTIELIDYNKDGKMDFVVGNHGTNSFLEKNMRMYINDFDDNGSLEQILCMQTEDGNYYPVLDKDELITQLPVLKKKIVFYKDYAEKTIEEIVGQSQISESQILQLNKLETTLFISKNNNFTQVNLPDEIQYSPIYSILSKKNIKTKQNFLYLGGNQYLVKPQFGSYDASKGWVLSLNSKQQDNYFNEAPMSLGINGQIRRIASIWLEKKEYLIFAINNETFQFYEIP